MDLSVIFKMAAIGIIVAVVNQILQKAGKEEYTLLTTLTGFVTVLLMILPSLKELMDELQSVVPF